MMRPLTMCAAAALLLGLSLPAAALPSTLEPAATVPQAAAEPEVQAFASSASAVAVKVKRDAYKITEIVPEPVYAAYGPYTGVYTGSFTGFTVWPANGPVNDGWGVRGGNEMHYGIDIMAPNGSAIVAAAPGVVTTVTFNGGWGQYVKIDHGDGIATLYAHMIAGSTGVTPGQKVSAGQFLGSVGNTGYSIDPHLHFEVYVNGGLVDPMPWMP